MSSSSSRSYNRFIPKEELDSASVTQWSFGAVGENAAGAVLPEPPPPEVPPEPEPLPQEEAPPVPMVPEAEHLSIVQQTPRTEQRLRKNPLGIYVNGLSWSRELEGNEGAKP